MRIKDGHFDLVEIVESFCVNSCTIFNNNHFQISLVMGKVKFCTE